MSADGTPFVSLVPYAVDAQQRCLVIHVSGLAAHTGNLQREPRVSLLVSQAAPAEGPVHALPRVTLEASAETLSPDSPEALAQYIQSNGFPKNIVGLTGTLDELKAVDAAFKTPGFGREGRGIIGETVGTKLCGHGILWRWGWGLGYGHRLPTQGCKRRVNQRVIAAPLEAADLTQHSRRMPATPPRDFAQGCASRRVKQVVRHCIGQPRRKRRAKG